MIDLTLLEQKYSKRASVVLQKYVGFFGVEVDVYADDSNDYSDTYGVSSGVDTKSIGTAKVLLFNYDMTPVSMMSAGVFTGGYIFYTDPLVDEAKTILMYRDGHPGRSYKVEQVESEGVTTQLYKVKKIVSIVI